MINKLDYIPVRKKGVNEVLKSIKKIGKINPNLKGVGIFSEKGERGDYGVTDYYTYNCKVYLIVDKDGARLDTKFYLSPDIKVVLSDMKRDAEKTR